MDGGELRRRLDALDARFGVGPSVVRPPRSLRYQLVVSVAFGVFFGTFWGVCSWLGHQGLRAALVYGGIYGVGMVVIRSVVYVWRARR